MLALICCCLLTACASAKDGSPAELEEPAQEPVGTEQTAQENQTETGGGQEALGPVTDAQEPEPETGDLSGEEQNEAPEGPNTSEAAPVGNTGAGYCVVIDPGHQLKGNSSQEPIGPGASETKAKVSSGTTGRYTGLTEYELNLRVSLLLRDELEKRGYRVVMTRTDDNVNISNRERAQIAADAGADAFVRIHANGSDDPSVSGALTICMAPDNPYCAQLYTQSRLDVAIVFSPAGDYILCLITNEFAGSDQVMSDMAKVSREIYDWVQAQS